MHRLLFSNFLLINRLHFDFASLLFDIGSQKTFYFRKIFLFSALLILGSSDKLTKRSGYIDMFLTLKLIELFARTTQNAYKRLHCKATHSIWMIVMTINYIYVYDIYILILLIWLWVYYHSSSRWIKWRKSRKAEFGSEMMLLREV